MKQEADIVEILRFMRVFKKGLSMPSSLDRGYDNDSNSRLSVIELTDSSNE